MSTRVRASGSINYIRNSVTNNSLELVLRNDDGTQVTATAGNVLIGLWAVDKSAGAFTPPAGWTVLVNIVGAETSMLLCGKISDGTETAVTASWSTMGEGASGLLTERAPSTAGNVLNFGPVNAPAYVTTARTSMSLGPLTAGSGIAQADAVAFFTIDSIGDTAGTASRFAPTATGWTHVLTMTAGSTGTGTPAAAITDRNTSVAAGESVPSATFSWVNADQALGAMVLIHETAGVPLEPVPAPVLSSRAVGIPSSTTVPLTVKTAESTSVRIKVGTNSAVTSGVVYSAPATPDAQGLSVHTVAGLTEGTQYYYRVAMTDANGVEHLDTSADVGEFRTAPVGQTSFAFCFASCSYDGMGDINASALAIAARKDAFFLSLGDWYDQDGSGSGVDNFRAKFENRMNTPGFAKLFATTPFAYTPSDHDGMANDSTAYLHPTNWASWNTVYRERIPTLSLPGSTGIYRTFTWGRVRFIVMDCRSFRGASGTTILGATQKQWLKDTIANSTEAAIVLAQDGIWIGSTNADTWHLYPSEQTELANFFAASGKPIVMLGGDMHAVAADDGTNSAGGIPVFQAAPLNGEASRKGGPYTHTGYPTSGSTVVQQYGRVVVTDNGTSISLAFTGHSADGTARVSLTETYSSATPEPEPPANRVVSGWSSPVSVVIPEPVVVEVSASFTGSGTLTATVSRQMTVAAALSGAGTLAATTRPELSRSAALTGSGTLSRTQSLAITAGATLAGMGTLSATISKRMTVAASLSGSGTLTATGVSTASVSASLTGSGTLSASTAVQRAVGASLTGTGTLSASSLRSTSIAASVSGAGTLGASSSSARSVNAAANATGDLTASTRLLVSRTATLSGSGSLTATSRAVITQSASLSGSGQLTGVAVVGGQALASLSGVGSLAATGQPTRRVNVSLTGSGTLNATVQARRTVSAGLSGSGTLTSTIGTVRRTASAVVEGSGTLVAQTALEGQIIASLSGSGTLTATASPHYTRAAALSGSGTLSATSVLRVSRSAALAGVGTLTAGVLRVVGTSAALTGSGLLTATSQPRVVQTVPLTGAGTLTAQVIAARVVPALLGGRGDLGFSTTVRLYSEGSVEGSGQLSADSTVQATVLAALSGESLLTVEIAAFGVYRDVTVTWDNLRTGKLITDKLRVGDLIAGPLGGS